MNGRFPNEWFTRGDLSTAKQHLETLYRLARLRRILPLDLHGRGFRRFVSAVVIEAGFQVVVTESGVHDDPFAPMQCRAGYGVGVRAGCAGGYTGRSFTRCLSGPCS